MKKKIIQNKNFILLLTSFILTGLVFTGVSSVIVTKRVSSVLVKKSVEEANYSLNQAYNTIYTVLTGVYGDYYDLWMREPTVDKLKGGNLEPQERAVLKETLMNQVIRNGYVNSIYIVDLENDYAISNSEDAVEIGDFYDQGAIELFRDFKKNYEKYKDTVFIPRYGKVNDKEDRRFMSIVYSDKALDKGLIVNIDEEKLSGSIMNNSEDTNTMIIDGENRIISDGRYNSFMSVYREPAPKEGGYEIIDYDGIERLVVGKIAKNLGFEFMYFRDYDSIEKEVRSTNRELSIIFGISILMNMFIGYIIAKKIYRPLDNLVKALRESESAEEQPMDEYEFLNSVYENLVDRNRKIELANILRGSKLADREMYTHIGLNEEEGFITFSIVSDTEYGDEARERTFKLLESIGAVVTMVSREELGGIVPTPKEENRLEDLLEQAKEVVEKVYIGIGTEIDGLEDIQKSYKKAKLAADYAYTENSDEVVSYGDISKNRETASEKKEQISNTVLGYIDENYGRGDLSSDEVAKKVGLSVGYLRQIFKEETGHTLNEYIVSTRIEKAKELLLSTDKTAKDIASEVGFYDSRYFYTTFKKKTGLTSEQFRKSGDGK